MSTRLSAGTVLALTRDECRLLAHASAAIRDKFRRDGLDSPALRALLADIYAVATDRGNSVADPLPTKPESGVPGQAIGSGWVSTRTAAQRLKISQRGVTSLLQSGHIVGRQQSVRSHWRVSEESLQQYAAEREAS